MADVQYLWQAVILPSWLSFASAPFVLIAYWLLGRHRREGWPFLMASQLGLVVIGLVHHEWGLVIVLLPMAKAAHNWRTWRPAA